MYQDSSYPETAEGFEDIQIINKLLQLVLICANPTNGSHMDTFSLYCMAKWEILLQVFHCQSRKSHQFNKCSWLLSLNRWCYFAHWINARPWSWVSLGSGTSAIVLRGTVNLRHVENHSDWLTEDRRLCSPSRPTSVCERLATRKNRCLRAHRKTNVVTTERLPPVQMQSAASKEYFKQTNVV